MILLGWGKTCDWQASHLARRGWEVGILLRAYFKLQEEWSPHQAQDSTPSWLMSGCNSINTTCGMCSGSWINVAKLLFPDLKQKKETLYIWAFLTFLLTHCLDSLGICQIISHYLAHLWEMPAIPLTTTHDVVIKLFVQVIKKRNGLHNHGVNLIWAELEFVAWQAKTNNI